MGLKFLVFGHKGWIGSQVMQHIKDLGHEAIGATTRADNEVDVAKEIDAVKPDRVVSLIGRTRGEGFLTIDYLEQKGKLVENMRDNLYGPMCLALLCKERGIHFTYMGTGCIFAYDDEHPMKEGGQGFTEESLPNFFGSSYSTCKGFTDRLMHFMDNVLNVRIRMPITPDHSPYNFITKIVKYQKICSLPNSMTILPQLMPVMISMAADKKTGTVNMTNPGVIAHNEVLSLYKKHVDPDFFWENFTQEEQDKILLGGRSNNLLETDVLKQYKPDVLDIHTAVEQVVIQMAKDHGKIDHGKTKN